MHASLRAVAALGRQTVSINALGNRTTTVFNTIGQNTALVDARGNRHSFTYDTTGARTQLIDPLNRRTTSAYDSAGQQTLRIDARGNRTTYAFSTLSQVSGRKYPNGSRASFSYDTTGNRTLMADATGRYTAVYDALAQTTVTASPNSQRVSYSYDAVGQRRSMDATGAGRFTYSYSAANQISSLLNPYTERTTFGYDDGSRRTVQRNANGTRVSMAYDAASQTTQVFHRTSAGATVLQLDYRYDAAGNRTVQIEGGASARTTWSYDAQNQLKGEHRTGTNAYRQTFTYDAASNRTLKNIDTVRTTYAYDAANQLKYGQAVAGRTSFQYDATGNQRIEQPPAGSRTTTTWGYENQPSQYRLPAGSPVTMTYNGDNRRIALQQSTNTTKFVWDAPVDAYLAELDGSNVVQAVYTNEPQRYGSVISQRRSSTSHWLHADALGSTRVLTTSAQASSDTYLCDAWGNLISSSGSTVNPFRWVGRYGYYFDSAAGLFYVRARIYQPTTAKWTSVDPLRVTVDMSLFAYVYFGQLNSIDPTGLFSITVPHGRSASWDNCGLVCLAADWQLTPKETNGYIIQRVSVSFLGKDCDSNNIAYFTKCKAFSGLKQGYDPENLAEVHPLVYFEMWPVKNGRIHLHREQEYPASFFHDRLGLCIPDTSSRTIQPFSMSTIAAFIPKVHPEGGWSDPPFGWGKWQPGDRGGVIWSGSLYSVCEEDVPGMIFEFQGRKIISRSVGAEWNCCDCNCSGQVTGNYGTGVDWAIPMRGCKPDRECSNGGQNDCAAK